MAGNRHVPSGLRRGIFGGMVAGPVCAGAGSPSDVMRRGGSFLRAPQSLPGCPGISGARARPAWREPATWGLLAQAHWASCVALRAKGRSFVREPQSLGGWRGGAGRWSVGARWCWALGDGTAAMQAADGDDDNDGAGGAVGGSEDLSSQHSPRAPDCQDSSGCLEGQGGSEGAVDEAAIALLRGEQALHIPGPGGDAATVAVGPGSRLLELYPFHGASLGRTSLGGWAGGGKPGSSLGNRQGCTGGNQGQQEWGSPAGQRVVDA